MNDAKINNINVARSINIYLEYFIHSLLGFLTVHRQSDLDIQVLVITEMTEF